MYKYIVFLVAGFGVISKESFIYIDPTTVDPPRVLRISLKPE